MIDLVGPRTLSSLLTQHARTAPDRTWLIFEAADGSVQRWSYAAFDRLVDQTVAALSGLGLAPGLAFNLHLPNSPEFLALWFAAARLGAIMVPTNIALTVEEMTYIVEHSESRLIVTTSEHLAVASRVQQRCPRVERVLVIDGPPTQHSWPLLSGEPPPMAGAAAASPAGASADADLALLYTSGTTARPKGCLITQAAYLYAGECMAKATRGGPDDRHLVVLPLFHAGAQTHSVMPALVAGAGIALMHRFSASQFFAQATRHGCTLSDLFAAPIRMILAQAATAADHRSPLRLVTFAQNVTPDELELWEQRSGVPLMQLWGMTETVGLPLMNPLDDRRDNMSLGLPVLGYQVKVIDDAGREVAVGQSGQLLVAGHPGRTLMRGYFKDPAATAATMRDGWLYSGDIVEVGQDGYLRFIDRAKDLIKRSGVNISAGEIEAVLKQHPGIFDAAVIGVPDAMRDEAIVACVIAQPGASIDTAALIDFCRQSLAAYKLPERIVPMSEFPRTPVGKIQKHRLREQVR